MSRVHVLTGTTVLTGKYADSRCPGPQFLLILHSLGEVRVHDVVERTETGRHYQVLDIGPWHSKANPEGVALTCGRVELVRAPDVTRNTRRMIEL